MRLGCGTALGVLVALIGLGGASLWFGARLVAEPDVVAAMGSPEDGVTAQQKIFDLVREESTRTRRTRRIVLTEAEINRFLSKNLVEVAKMPVSIRAVRLAGDGIVEFKAQLSLRDLLSASPFMSFAGLAPAGSLERSIWLHLRASANLEVGASRRPRRSLRFDVQRFAIGRQTLPRVLLRFLPSAGLQQLLRWRIPESVEAITIDPGAAVIRTSS